jgi:hypothetical protein
MLALRNYEHLRRLIEDRPRFVTVAEAYRAAGAEGATLVEIAAATGLALAAVGRVVTWLLKYDYLGEIVQKKDMP